MAETTRLITICNALRSEIARQDGLLVPESPLLRVAFLHLLHVERLTRAAVILADAGASGTTILQARAVFEALVNLLYLWRCDGNSDDLAAWWDFHEVEHCKILTALQRLSAEGMSTNPAPSAESLLRAERERTAFRNTYHREVWSTPSASTLEQRAFAVQRSGLLERIESSNVNLAEDYALFYRAASSHVHVSSTAAAGVFSADGAAITVRDDDEKFGGFALGYAGNHAVVMMRAWLALNDRAPAEIAQLLEQARPATSGSL